MVSRRQSTVACKHCEEPIRPYSFRIRVHEAAAGAVASGKWGNVIANYHSRCWKEMMKIVDEEMKKRDAVERISAKM